MSDLIQIARGIRKMRYTLIFCKNMATFVEPTFVEPLGNNLFKLVSSELFNAFYEAKESFEYQVEIWNFTKKEYVKGIFKQYFTEKNNTEILERISNWYALQKEAVEFFATLPGATFDVVINTSSFINTIDDTDIVEFMLKIGANPNIVDDYGVTPLSRISFDLRRIELLLAFGAKVNSLLVGFRSAGSRTTVLHEHIGGFRAYGKTKGKNVINMLLKHGASLGMKDNLGRTPIQFCKWMASQYYEYTCIYNILLEEKRKRTRNALHFILCYQKTTDFRFSQIDVNVIKHIATFIAD